MKKAEGLMGRLGFSEDEEERVCPEHGRYISHLTYLKGELKNASGCPKCRAIQLQKRQEDEERERKEREELEKRRAYEQTLDRTAIPTKYRSRTLASFRTDGNDQKAKVLKIAESYITKFDALRQSGIGMVFIGECGTGKTHLACAVLQELLSKCAGIYTTAHEMGQTVADSWGCREPGKTTADVKRAYKTCPLLVVDEVAKEDAKPITKEVLSEVLYARYDTQLPTIWITNADPTLLKTAIGEQEYDRLKETCKFIRLSWPSMRKNDIDF